MAPYEKLPATVWIAPIEPVYWAFVKPVRKLYYNLNITLVSVLVALLVGTIEALNVIAGQLNLRGAWWDVLGGIGDNFGTLGFAIVAIFAGSWLVSTLLYRLRGYDKLEAIPIPSERIA